MSDELTPWFSSDVEPARIGVYMVSGDLDSEFISYQNWNGHWWGFRESSVSTAHIFRDHVSAFQRLNWRGLAKAPK